MNEELTTKIQSVTTCDLYSANYCLSFGIANSHTSLSTWSYKGQAGHINNIDLYDMTPELMYELAQKIIDAANKISNRGLDVNDSMMIASH